ncbi:MAG: alpha-E domain-containing protein [Opitutales bacterium]|nr:alpha-E domain-containing protein [Opitutales bacterium]MCH8541124.1 alpha-E domain-containing protein [Opitutales bacterium]
MILLSRVADCLYWMSRYIERAENVARIVDVNLQLLLDSEDLNDSGMASHWMPIVKSTGDEALFARLYDKPDSGSVTDFLTFNRENPGSILSCILAARENARQVRDKISTEVWEEVNRLYHFVRAQNIKRIWASGPYEFYKQIKQSSHLLQGLSDATVVRDEGWEFIQVGRYLERADQTTRILDVKYHILLPSPRDVGGARDTLQWMAVLRSCSAFEAYHHIYGADVQPWNVADFLIFSETFPRSISFCLRQLSESLRRISGERHRYFSNEAERLAGKLQADLNYTSTEEIFRRGLHEQLLELQDCLADVGMELFEAYMFFPVVDPSKEDEEQGEK